MSAAATERRWFVYRCYDADRTLLYVGMTAHLRNRERGHRSRSPWFPKVTRVRLDGPFARDGARALEGWRIMREHPLHNKQRGYAQRDYDTWRCTLAGIPTPWADRAEIERVKAAAA